MALGKAHNVITPDDLKELKDIPSHELVNYHIHKLVQVTLPFFPLHILSLSLSLSFLFLFFLTFACGQVLGEMLHVTTKYLFLEERVVMANAKAKSLEAETSRLRKDLINAMEDGNVAKEKIKSLGKELKVEKALTV